MRRAKFLAVLVVTLLFAMPDFGAAADQLGVVLMHGKQGTSKPRSPVGQLKAELESAGFIVMAPDMPWSRLRFLEKDFETAMAEIDGYVEALRSRGAKRIVVGGHSIGANAALGYGARREGLAGVLAIAPGHIPELQAWRDRYEFSIDEAREQIAAGNPDAVVELTDVNQGRETEVTLKAKVVASWYAPDTGAVMPINAANLKTGTPLMWVVGEKDRMAKRGEAYAFAKAPANPKSRYAVVKGGHKVTPMKGKAEIIDWLNSL